MQLANVADLFADRRRTRRNVKLRDSVPKIRQLRRFQTSERESFPIGADDLIAVDG